MRKMLYTCLAFLLSASVFAGDLKSDLGCPDSKILGARLIDGICWTCMFPTKIMGTVMQKSGGYVPSSATRKIVCRCDDKDPLSIGFTAGMWNPSRIIEVVRNPWCMPTMGGKKLMDNYELVAGNPYSSNLSGNDYGQLSTANDGYFMNVHFLAFPLLQIMEMIAGIDCNPEGYTELDIIAMSELDPTHSDPELEFFTNPFGAAFAEWGSIMAGVSTCVAETAGIETDEIFWWDGCLGPVYPTSGFISEQASLAADTSLLSVKYLAKLHMTGLARKTMGDDGICRGALWPMLPKSQYRMSRLFPVSESSKPCCHSIGASTFSWGGEHRNIPGISDYTYLLWRWTDCCMLVN